LIVRHDIARNIGTNRMTLRQGLSDGDKGIHYCVFCAAEALG
jgi:hypothetical protein